MNEKSADKAQWQAIDYQGVLTIKDVLRTMHQSSAHFQEDVQQRQHHITFLRIHIA